jgi:putative tricarboxylic transport membrane protein
LRPRSSAIRGLARRLPAAALIGLGIAALYEASSLSFGTVREPGSGFFPVLVSLVLIAFGAVSFAAAPVSPGQSIRAEAHAEARPWILVAALAAYAWAIVPVGFLLSTTALLLVLLRGIGRARWQVSIALAAFASLACYLLFTRLGMPLPPGVLGL